MQVSLSMAREQHDAVITTKSYDEWDGQLAYPLWSENDSIGVFSKTKHTKLTLSSGEDTNVGVFEGMIGTNAPYCVYYPYNASATVSGSTAEDQTINTAIPVIQVAGVNNIDENALIAVGTAETSGDGKFNDVTLKNGYGLIKINITTDDITAITIESVSGQPIAGECSFKVKDGSISGDVKNASSIVSLITDQNDGVFLKGNVYSIAVIPGTQAEGLRVYVKKYGTRKSAIASISQSIDIKRNGGVEFPEYSLSGKDYCYYLIFSKADLNEWNSDGANWKSTDKVYLCADINYGDEEWSKSIKTFLGTFDGRGHSITHFFTLNDEYRSGFFHNVTGTVKNITFGAADDTYSYIMIDGCAAPVESDQWYYAAPIAYLGKGGQIQNVTNYLPVHVTNENANPNWFRIGGIAGTLKGDNVISDCKNYGNITLPSTIKVRDTDGHRSEAGTNLVGGIVSGIDNEYGGWTISRCENHGNITNKCPYFCRIGGIVGSIHEQKSDPTHHHISECKNTGTITNEAAIINRFRLCLGGIVGYANKMSVISGSENSGNICVKGTPVAGEHTKTVFAGGIIAIQEDTTDMQITNCTNSGTISTTADALGILKIGGIVADAVGDITGCTNTGNITMGGNVALTLYCSGVCGLMDTTGTGKSGRINNCINSGDISCGSITISGQLFVGGVIGGEFSTSSVTHTNLSNSGVISLGKSESDKISSSSTEYSYIGGIAGGSKKSSAGYTNCANHGNITYRGDHGANIGGIVGYAGKVPSKVICEADIRVVGTKFQCYVGGIIGRLAAGETVEGLKYVGNITTSGSSPIAYTGGIAGVVETNCAFSKCKIGGSVSGVTLSSTNTEVGLICCGENETPEFTFTDCVIETGTTRGGTQVTSLVVKSDNSDLTKGALCGGKCSESSSMTNCKIGSID